MFTSLKKKLFGGAAKNAPDTSAQSQNPPPTESAANAADFKKRASALLQQGDLREAVQCYRQALALAPNDVGVLVNLGFALSELEQYAEARSHLEKAALLDPKQDDALYILGTIHRSTGSPDKAIEYFRSTLDLKPDFSICRLDLCRLLFERADVHGAKEVIQAGIAIEPDSADFYYYLGNLHHEARDLDQAVASFERAISLAHEHDGAYRSLGASLQQKGDLEAALRAYNAIRATDSEDGPRYLRLGMVFHNHGLLARAVECAQRAIDLNPTWAEAHAGLGSALQAQGELAKAVAMYERAVALQPNYALAHHSLGMALQVFGKLDAAIDSYRLSIALMPNSADMHSNLGTALQAQGHLEAAAVAYRRALELRPDHPQAHCSLASILHAQGLFDAAVEGYLKALESIPNLIQALTGLAASLQAQGKLDESVRRIEQIVVLQPEQASGHSQLAAALHAQGRLDDAIRSYRTALSLSPDFAEAHANMGTVLHDQGDLPAAIESYRAALAIEPSFAQGHSNLAIALQAQGKFSEAVRSYEKAIALMPTNAEAHCGLGTALQEQGEQSAAIDSYRIAISLNPEYADAHSNLGTLLQRQGKLDAAYASYRKALSLKPDSGIAHGNVGSVLQEMGEHDAAIASLRHALTLKSDYGIAQYTLLFTLNYHPDKSAQEIFAAYREYDERVGLPLRRTWRTHANSRDVAKRLRVGYVSPDFRKHSVRHFLEPLLAHHDKRLVEVFAYAELSTEDATTVRYRGYVDHWVPTVGLSDEALAERIRSDGIDILVDLAGHTAKNRLRAFARKPAPVSMSWLGFGYTTGLSAIDYMLTDGASAPEGSEDLFAEQPWRLTTPGYAYRPAEGMGEVNALPAQSRGFVTFGTLTRSVRINHRTVRVWSQILQRIPGTRLVIDSGNYRDAQMRSTLLEKFSAHGIGPERLEIGFHSPPWDVLRGMDIGLDCFPHNSGTTLFESLYMGVPYVTLAGRPSVGRLGSSILQGVGHPEWIAHSEDEYVELAVALASDLPRLAALRAGLRAQMQASPLMDEPGFARKVEAAYREMFSRWVASSASAR